MPFTKEELKPLLLELINAIKNLVKDPAKLAKSEVGTDEDKIAAVIEQCQRDVFAKHNIDPDVGK